MFLQVQEQILGFTIHCLSNLEKIYTLSFNCGSHVSKYHGHTISEIYDAGFEKVKSIETLQIDDSPKGVSKSYGITVLKFGIIGHKTNLTWFFV